MDKNSPPIPLLSFAFRPFFLLTGVYAVLVIVAWVAFMVAGRPLPLGWSPVQWHSHEMLYGLVPAAMAGFLLTAMCNWTGAPPLRGRGLVAMILVWLAGRLVFWFSALLPVWLVAAVDLVFLPVLAIYVARILIRYQNRRNLILVLALVLLAIGNLLMHVGYMIRNRDILLLGQLEGLDVVVLLMVVIAGRITPAFSANWLKAHGRNAAWVKRSDWLDRLAIISMLLLVALEPLPLSAQVMGIVALVAGSVNLVRLLGWSGWRVLSEPLLWVLHLSYFWIVLGLLVRGAAEFDPHIPPSAWMHLLGAGAIATLILGVMTRVALGHTGRHLRLPRFGVVIYMAIILATVLRVLVAMHWLDFRTGIMLTAANWMLAFGLFVILFAPVLSGPRPDGRPG